MPQHIDTKHRASHACLYLALVCLPRSSPLSSSLSPTRLHKVNEIPSSLLPMIFQCFLSFLFSRSFKIRITVFYVLSALFNSFSLFNCLLQSKTNYSLSLLFGCSSFLFDYLSPIQQARSFQVRHTKIVLLNLKTIYSVNC